MTARWFWLASAISFLISSELLALPVNTSTIERAERIAWTIASWKFSPGPMSREASQHARPRRSSASQTRAAILRSCDEWLIKTNGCIAAAADASIAGRFTATVPAMPAGPRRGTQTRSGWQQSDDRYRRYLAVGRRINEGPVTHAHLPFSAFMTRSA